MSKNQHLEQLRQLLRQGPAKATTLLQALEISQPTFSRLWALVRDGVVLGAGKSRLYALQRSIAGVDAPIPVFQLDADGHIALLGNLDVLEGGYYAMRANPGNRYEVYQGIPFFMRDLRPQGFLGRMEPGRHRELELPANILHWTDEQTLKYITRRSEYAAGDLILGNESYARYLASAGAQATTFIPAAQRTTRYPQMAQESMQGEAPGSSAGGEQPKFTAAIAPLTPAAPPEHVIVKFSPPLDTPSGRRWGDLLVCEHLALQVLAQHGIAAAHTSIVEAEARIFLQVLRFDRVGLKGRAAMATFSALDGELGMMDQNWSAVAQELGSRGELAKDDVRSVEILDLYGALIANTDKHHGNIAVHWTLQRKLRLLPAYDMLPMLYRPNAHGEIIERTWSPIYLHRLELRHLPICYPMALAFWQAVLADGRISDDFKRIARQHLAALQPLAPASYPSRSI